MPCSLSPADPPVYTGIDTLTVIEGDSEVVQYDLEGNSLPTMASWFFNGDPIVSIPGLITLSVDFISFDSPIDRSQAGVYSVESFNEAGRGNTSFMLMVYCELELGL